MSHSLYIPHLAALVLTLSLLAPRAASARPPSATNAVVERIAFGSCDRKGKGQSHWKTIGEAEPDLWIWLGDSVYADTRDMGVMRATYQDLFTNTHYAAFRTATDIIGTWDDHDYGVNDGRATYPKRVESQQHLLDFLEVPATHPRRTRAGVYGSYDLGPAGRDLRVILLDGRYHAEKRGPTGRLLGDEQWAFLEHALSNTTTRLTLICSGIQVLPEDHRYEHWMRYPRERQRLLDLIRRSRAEGVMLLSGDRHFHKISLLNDARVHYPLLEITSSGLNDAYGRLKRERNRYRVGEKYTQPGFGMLEIDWSAEPATVSLQVRSSTDGDIARRFDLPIEMLRPNKDIDER